MSYKEPNYDWSEVLMYMAFAAFIGYLFGEFM